MATQGDFKILVNDGAGNYDEIDPANAEGSDVDDGSRRDKIVTPESLHASTVFKRIHVGTTAPSDTTMLWLDTN